MHSNFKHGRYVNQHAAWWTVQHLIRTLRMYRGHLGIVVSVERIAKDMRVSERTVQRAAADAVRQGFIRRNVQVDGKGGGPARNLLLWHQSRTNEYFIVGEPRYEKVWRWPRESARLAAQRMAPESFGTLVLTSKTHVNNLAFLTAWTVDNPPPEDSGRCSARPGRAHVLAESGYCVWCAERVEPGTLAWYAAAFPENPF